MKKIILILVILFSFTAIINARIITNYKDISDFNTIDSILSKHYSRATLTDGSIYFTNASNVLYDEIKVYYDILELTVYCIEQKITFEFWNTNVQNLYDAAKSATEEKRIDNYYVFADMSSHSDINKNDFIFITISKDKDISVSKNRVQNSMNKYKDLKETELEAVRKENDRIFQENQRKKEERLRQIRVQEAKAKIIELNRQITVLYEKELADSIERKIVNLMDSSSYNSIDLATLNYLIKSDKDRFKLYPTSNMWTFLQLDTRTGTIYTMQFTVSGDEDYRYKNYLGTVYPNSDCGFYNGRFELYPTENIYNFILVDKCGGQIWQVQRGENKMIIEIKESRN